MQLFIMLMPRRRKAVTYRIDELVIDALGKIAKKQNMSANRYLENLLFNLGQENGIIPIEEERLGETRGGDRSKLTNEADD